MVYTHFTDGKLEAQVADVTCLHLRTGIQKLTSSIIPRRLPEMSETPLSVLEGSMPNVWISSSVWRTREQLIGQHPGEDRALGSCPGSPT